MSSASAVSAAATAWRAAGPGANGVRAGSAVCGRPQARGILVSTAGAGGNGRRSAASVSAAAAPV